MLGDNYQLSIVEDWLVESFETPFVDNFHRASRH